MSMYLEYFGLKETPFSIAPDPRYLYMSERHREALAHLLYGVTGQGGFVVLTGEVGTGKTTICRCFLNQIPDNTDVAFIINPKLSARELMATICDELSIPYPESASIKVLNDLINHYLLAAHAEKRHTVLIIDEAQNLRVDVLEQLRLLTNLETSEKKLLQIILLGQPELRELLARNELRQLAQRITARYHLHELNKMEVGAYVQCRLAVAGRRGRLFTLQAIKQLYKLTGGVPRLINLISDRALLGAYASQSEVVDADHIKLAHKEIQGEKLRQPLLQWPLVRASVVALGLFFFFSGAFFIFEAVKNKPEIASSIMPTESGQVTNSSSMIDQALAETAAPKENTVQPSRNGAPYLSHISELSPSDNDRMFAYQALFKRWGVEYSKEPSLQACDFAEMYGLRCLHNNGNWRSLLKLNLPTVMALRNDLGETIYISLLAVDSLDALISFQGELFWVSMDEIDSYWLGEYSLLWKLPPYRSRVVVPGQETEEDWLHANLSRLGSAYTTFDESLTEKVKRFQLNAGLVPDGIAGAMTIIQINKRLCQDCPKLMGGL